MYQNKKRAQTIQIAILMLIGAAQLMADTIIYNKTVVAPGSIAHGNTGVIIDGNKIAPKARPQRFHYITMSLAPITQASIDVEDLAITITPGHSLTYPKGLHPLQQNGILLIHSDALQFSGAKLKISSDTLQKILVNADSATLSLKKPIASVDFKGDGVVECHVPLSHLTIESSGDLTIQCDKPIEKLSLRYNGDIILTARSLKTLELEGEGDLTLDIPDTTKIIRKKEHR